MCVHCKEDVTLLTHTDNGTFLAKDMAKIDQRHKQLVEPLTDKDGKVHRPFRMTDEGDLSDYLKVKIERLPNGLIKLCQPHLINQIISELSFNKRTTTKPTPAVTTIRLGRDLHGEPFNEEWHCRSIVGKLNFLEKSMRPDVTHAVHQRARFSNDPKASHAQAIKRTGKCLSSTPEEGTILNPCDHSFDCWADADFVGNWSRLHSNVDPATAKSHTGCTLTCGSCPSVWASRLQRQVALSSTEDECNALSEVSSMSST